tara:strand:- start:415 stop:522 length:108 start_codon:yes stop_codon:yes gene_type:complete
VSQWRRRGRRDRGRERGEGRDEVCWDIDEEEEGCR